jgi:hypothetical protein
MSGWSTISTSGLPAARAGERDQFATLLTAHRVIPSVEVPAGQGGDRLEADHHPDVGDDLEHLPDAVVGVAEEGPHGRLATAEHQLAGRGPEDAHLVLDIGRDDPVGAEEFPGLRVEQLRGNDEQRQPFRPRAALAVDSVGAGQDAVDDVLGRIVRGPRDEAFRPRQVPRAVVGEGRTGAPQSHVGAGVGLGEHHRHGPVALKDELGQALLILGAVAVQHGDDGGDELAAHRDCRVGAEDEFRCRPTQ